MATEDWYDQALNLVESGDLETALEYFDKAIEEDPDNEDYWASKGTTLAGLGRHEEAIECFDRTLALDHDFVAVLDEHLPGQAGRVRKYRFSTIGTFKLRV